MEKFSGASPEKNTGTFAWHFAKEMARQNFRVVTPYTDNANPRLKSISPLLFQSLEASSSKHTHLKSPSRSGPPLTAQMHHLGGKGKKHSMASKTQTSNKNGSRFSDVRLFWTRPPTFARKTSKFSGRTGLSGNLCGVATGSSLSCGFGQIVCGSVAKHPNPIKAACVIGF